MRQLAQTSELKGLADPIERVFVTFNKKPAAPSSHGEHSVQEGVVDLPPCAAERVLVRHVERRAPASCDAAQRRLFGSRPFVGVNNAVQKLVICFTPSVIIVAAWRFASAVIRLRAAPAMALAPLSHMLRKGFFFVHGFFIAVS
jgi:hypothetical protein